MHDIGFEHHVQPNKISITQATELGTVYTEEEVSAICKMPIPKRWKCIWMAPGFVMRQYHSIQG